MTNRGQSEVLDRKSTANGRRKTARLLEAVNAESRALNELADVLDRQREAIARRDADVVQCSVQTMQNVMLTLAAATRRRQELAEIYADLCDQTAPSSAVVTACRQAEEAAMRVERELTANQRELNRAIRDGEVFAQRLFSTMTGRD